MKSKKESIFFSLPSLFFNPVTYVHIILTTNPIVKLAGIQAHS